MRTTKEERAARLEMLEQNVKDGGTFHRGVLDFESRLIADVEDAVGLFERVLSGSADGLLLGEIRAFLKEPKQ